MNKQPTVSVLMSIYSDPLDFVKLAVESILEQSFNDFEFLVVNNKPGDRALDELLASHAEADPRVRVIKNKTHTLLSQSLNNGLQYVSGKYTARMDADDVAMPNRLQTQVDYLNTHAAISLVGSNVLLIDEQGEEISVLKRPLSDKSIKTYHRYGIGGCVMHPTWMARSEFFRELGGYRELLANTEDYDLLLRGALAGHSYANLSQCCLKYRIREGLSIGSVASQMAHAKTIRKLFASGELNNVEKLADIMKQTQARLGNKDGDETRALLQLYDFKKNIASGKYAVSFLNLVRAFLLSPVLSFDVMARNAILNKLLV